LAICEKTTHQEYRGVLLCFSKKSLLDYTPCVLLSVCESCALIIAFLLPFSRVASISLPIFLQNIELFHKTLCYSIIVIWKIKIIRKWGTYLTQACLGISSVKTFLDSAVLSAQSIYPYGMKTDATSELFARAILRTF